FFSIIFYLFFMVDKLYLFHSGKWIILFTAIKEIVIIHANSYLEQRYGVWIFAFSFYFAFHFKPVLSISFVLITLFPDFSQNYGF
ncbi:MAG: hypothetical protein J1G30_07300, partial [Spirochaetales bacterium]|nr:hypothetical protein [Spirochaetales bacterium]